VTRLPFFSNCVDWDRADVPSLQYLIDEGRQISRDTLLRNVALELQPDECYYPRRGDYAVTYWTLPDLPVYWYVHSAIEFVYAERDVMALVSERARVAA
jgi:hypothetical protein